MYGGPRTVCIQRERKRWRVMISSSIIIIESSSQKSRGYTCLAGTNRGWLLPQAIKHLRRGPNGAPLARILCITPQDTLHARSSIDYIHRVPKISKLVFHFKRFHGVKGRVNVRGIGPVVLGHRSGDTLFSSLNPRFNDLYENNYEYDKLGSEIVNWSRLTSNL